MGESGEVSLTTKFSRTRFYAHRLSDERPLKLKRYVSHSQPERFVIMAFYGRVSSFHAFVVGQLFLKFFVTVVVKLNVEVGSHLDRLQIAVGGEAA